MSIPGSGSPLLLATTAAAAAAEYVIPKSLRFNDGDSAHLTRTFQAGNQKKWTWSSWIKRAKLGATGRILRANPSGEAGIQFNSDDRIEVYHYQNSSYVVRVITERVFRDPSAWFHLVIVYDSDQATAADRLVIYINGVKETQFNTSTYPSQGYQSYLNSATSHAIFGSDLFPAGLLAEVQFVDGQALLHLTLVKRAAATAFGCRKSTRFSYYNWVVQLELFLTTTATTVFPLTATKTTIVVRLRCIKWRMLLMAILPPMPT